MKLLRKRHATRFFAGILISAAALHPASAQTPQLEGQPVANIVFEPVLQPLEGRELFDMLPVKRGRPYRAAEVRTAIERLYATGRYQDIQVDAEPGGAGLVVRFVTKNRWFIGNVSSRDDLPDPPSSGQIVSAARLRLGDPFDAAQIPGAVANIERLLADNGYFGAVVTPHYQYDAAHEQVHIDFEIKAGKRAVYAEPSITFAKPGDEVIVPRSELIKASRWKRLLLPGYDGIKASETHTGIDRIRLKYENVNRLLATVVLNQVEELNPKQGRPRISIDAGPLVEIKTTGARISRKQLQESVPVFEEHAIDADLLAEGTNELRSYFQSQGYFDAEVSLERQQVTGDKREVEYLVERGLLHRMVALDISGNKYFRTEMLRERMFVAPRSFELSRGRYSETFRKRDIETIEALYQSNGFRDVVVTARAEDNYKGRRGDIAAHFTIEEGPQYTVSSLAIHGNKALDLTKTIESLSSQAGQPFSEFNIAGDRQTLLDQYGESGFAHTTFEWTSKPGPRPHTFDVEFAIDEGGQEFVREVVITGLERTRPDLVNKQIQLNPGSPLSPAAMAETQKRLEDLGIFAKVDMAVQNPDGAEERKYVVYNVDEASRYSLTTGAGFEFARIGGNNAATNLSDPGGGTGVSPRVSIGLTRLNFLGRGESINFQGRLSTLQKRAVANYFIPKPRNHQKLDVTISVLYDDTHDVRTFEAKREEVAAQLSQRITKPITLFYRFTYRHVGVSNLKIDPLLLPRLAESVRVGLAQFNLVQDRRDDPVDPHKGLFNSIDLSVASAAFGSQTSFGRLLGRNATYYKLGSKIVLARETQLGIQPAFSVPNNSDPTDPIPLPERFFGGGGNTQRGFPENQAGPRDLLTGFPLGGSALFFNNTELRFPLLGANINGVLFEDAGNVYSTLGNLSFRVKQSSISDFDYMVHAAGFGIRFKTPVGPLRLDLAYSINPPRFNGFPGNFEQLVQCSAAGTCQASPQQISHFQFFFSIGQAF
jgi:outer membrane protein insertion porin family